jgi:hypothetical protein
VSPVVVVVGTATHSVKVVTKLFLTTRARVVIIGLGNRPFWEDHAVRSLFISFVVLE